MARPSADVTRDDPDPSRRTPAAIGGTRTSRTTSSLEKTTLTARPRSVRREGRAASPRSSWRRTPRRYRQAQRARHRVGTTTSPGRGRRPTQVIWSVMSLAWGPLHRVGQVWPLRLPWISPLPGTATANLRHGPPSAAVGHAPGSPPGPNRRRSHRGRAPRTAARWGSCPPGRLARKAGSLGWPSAVSPGTPWAGAVRVVQWRHALGRRLPDGRAPRRRCSASRCSGRDGRAALSRSRLWTVGGPAQRGRTIRCAETALAGAVEHE